MRVVVPSVLWLRAFRCCAGLSHGVAGGKGNTRTTGLEQYYTPAAVADVLVNHLVDVVGVDTDALWLEPAAGSGNFVAAAHRAGVSNVCAYDIAPAASNIVAANFLDVDLSGRSHVVCVTNPPFGRNHALSVPFFNHAAACADVIAFIVPRSWRKWSVVNRLDRGFVKVADHDIDVSYVDRDGDPLSSSSQLNTVFQVWMRTSTRRPVFPCPPADHQFEVVSPLEANVALTVFGRGAGKVRTEFPRVANTTQMFIKADPDTVTALAQLDLSPFYTQVAYVEALSRKEVDAALVAHKAGTRLSADFLTCSTLSVHAAPNPLTVAQATAPIGVPTPTRPA